MTASRKMPTWGRAHRSLEQAIRKTHKSYKVCLQITPGIFREIWPIFDRSNVSPRAYLLNLCAVILLRTAETKSKPRPLFMWATWGSEFLLGFEFRTLIRQALFEAHTAHFADQQRYEDYNGGLNEGWK
jgi:hypothetical protein